MLSCSGDKSAIIWKKSTRSKQLNYSQTISKQINYEIEFILTGHNSSIDIGCSIVLENKILTITSSNDLAINIWKNDQLVNSKQDQHFTFDIKLIKSDFSLFKDKIIAVFASSDANVHLFKIDEQLNLGKIIKLVGHYEWVRSVDFIFQNQGKYYLCVQKAKDNLSLSRYANDCFWFSR